MTLTLVFTVLLVAPPGQKWPLDLLLSTGVTLAWYRFALSLVRKRERFTQTMTAIFATRVFFTPVLIPMSSAVNVQLKSAATGATALGILTLALFVWQFVIQVRIVRSAFEWPISGAIALVLAQIFATAAILAVTFGLPTKPV